MSIRQTRCRTLGLSIHINSEIFRSFYDEAHTMQWIVRHSTLVNETVEYSNQSSTRPYLYNIMSTLSHLYVIGRYIPEQMSGTAWTNVDLSYVCEGRKQLTSAAPPAIQSITSPT